MRVCVCLSLCVTVFSGAVSAAPPAPVDDLKKQVQSLEDELAKLRSQLPAAIDALHALENRADALAHHVERLSAERETTPFAQKAIDELRAQVNELEHRTASTQFSVGDLRAAAEPAVKLGYDDGVYVKTAPVTVWLNAGIMPRWYGIIRLHKSNDSNFELHHGQIELRADVMGFVAMQLMLDFGSEFLGDGRISILRDAFIDVRPVSWLTVRVGQFKVPFSHQRLVSSFQQSFTERTLATRAFTLDRDLGGELELRFLRERLLIQLAVTDGIRAGATAKNDNLDFAYTARIVAQPLGPLPLVEGDVARGTRPPRFSVGGAFQFNLVPNDLRVDLDKDGVVDNIEVFTVGAEAVIRWHGLSAEGEYFYRLEAAGAGLPKKGYQGVYGQGTAMLWRGLQVGVRYSYAQPHVLAGAAKLGVLGDQPRWGLEAGGVINYYFWRDKVRLQAAYDYRRDAAAAVKLIEQGHVVQLQLMAYF